MKLTLGYFLLPITAVIAFLAMASTLHSAVLPDAPAVAVANEQEISAAMQQWITAVAEKQAVSFSNLVDSSSERYYLRLRDHAISTDAEDLLQLSEVDQLQVMFFRLMVDAQQLRDMNAQQLIAFAVEKGFIGMELRHADRLGEIRISGDTATGRLFKFGLTDRPDRYIQHFVKEQGVWQVSLQGERERLEGEFDEFVRRSGLSRSEAAFLILEMRLMRKVTAADFFMPRAQVVVVEKERRKEPESIDASDRFRLVSVRLCETLIGISAATVDDTHTGLKTVLHRGDSLPGNSELELSSISPEKVLFRNTARPAASVTLKLNASDRLDRRAVVAPATQDSAATLIDEASLGEKYPGQMMMQWRNVGLRGRAQLLQQAWLTPDFADTVGPEKSMLGLKVRQVGEASFWDQIGLEEGDLLTEINGLPINTLDAWKKAIRIAETDQEIEVRLQRGDHELIFRTLTVKPG